MKKIFFLSILLIALCSLSAFGQKVKASLQDVIQLQDSTNIIVQIDSSGKNVFRRMKGAQVAKKAETAAALASLNIKIDTKTMTPGPKGDPGGNGLNGIQGEQGANGTNGINGAKGDKGDRGIDGINGNDGINGTNGANGAKGDRGIDGINGTNGNDGINGINGAKGDTGLIDSATLNRITKSFTKNVTSGWKTIATTLTDGSANFVIKIDSQTLYFTATLNQNGVSKVNITQNTIGGISRCDSIRIKSGGSGGELQFFNKINNSTCQLQVIDNLGWSISGFTDDFDNTYTSVSSILASNYNGFAFQTGNQFGNTGQIVSTQSGIQVRSPNGAYHTLVAGQGNDYSRYYTGLIFSPFQGKFGSYRIGTYGTYNLQFTMPKNGMFNFYESYGKDVFNIDSLGLIKMPYLAQGTSSDSVLVKGANHVIKRIALSKTEAKGNLSNTLTDFDCENMLDKTFSVGALADGSLTINLINPAPNGNYKIRFSNSSNTPIITFWQGKLKAADGTNQSPIMITTPLTVMFHTEDNVFYKD